MVYAEEINAGNIDVFQPLIPKMLQQLSLTEENWRFYGIESRDEACGVISVFERGDTAVLRYIYLLPGYRNQGIIDDAITRLLVSLYNERFSFVQMDYIPSEYPNIAKLARRFDFKDYKSDRAYFKFTVADIRNCKAMSYSSHGIVRLRALPQNVRNNLYDLVVKSGYDVEASMFQSDINTLEYSVVYMEGDKPKGLLMVNRMDRNPKTTDIAFGRVFPEASAADIALVYVGSKELRVPLYLLSALCQNVIRDFESTDIITGYFPEGHLTRLLEGTLNIKGRHEVSSVFRLDTLEDVLEDDGYLEELLGIGDRY